MPEETKALQIGVSRPALGIQDLPTPEEVFKIPCVNLKCLVKYVIGPSLIALGVSIGSGEWLLGPLNVATYGFVGIGWVILVSALLQTFYNVEVARFTVATGETPMVAFGRTPPGFFFWMPFAMICFYFAFIWGGWAAGCGQALFAIFHGRANTPQEMTEVRWWGVALNGVVFLAVLFGKKISRTLELWNGFMVAFILISLIFFVLALVPLSTWASGFASLVTPAMPPKGSDARLLGGLAGFTATAAGLNWFIIGYYRDKGYGMGYRTGFIAGLVGGKQEQILHAGVTFPENEKNASLWKRWFRLLSIDQWGVFFPGAILGMLLPCILVGYLASLPGADKANTANMPIYAGMQMSKQYGGLFFYWAQLVGLFVLFSTQMVVFETLVRNFVDSAYAVSSKFRNMVHGDPRLFYYPFMIVLAVVISILIFTQLPTDLILISANMSNFASLFFPLVMMYLSSKLPRPANITWWSYLVLALNVIFFGFFFFNFAAVQFPMWFTGKLGTPLIRF